MSRPLLVSSLISAAFVACLAISTTFHLYSTPRSQREDPADAPSAQGFDLLTVPLLSVPAGDLVCLYIKDSDTPCSLEFHPTNKRNLLKLGAFDHPDDAVILSPDKLFILLIAEEKAMVLSSDTFAVVFEQLSGQGYVFGTYGAFPSFFPKGRWTSTTTIELSFYAPDTLEPYDNAPSNVQPIPVSVEEFDVLSTDRTR